MNDMALVFACLAASLGWAAWREHRNRNRADTALLGLCGALSGVGVALATLV